MRKADRFSFIVLFFALILAMPTLAQETEGFDPEDYGIYGDVEIGDYEPLEEADDDRLDDGVIRITAITPTDQTANINIVGPDGYREHLEADEGSELVVNDLLPGIYSIAATDDGLRLAEAKVEVRAGQAVPVTLDLARLPGAPFDPAAYTPYGRFEVGVYEPYDEAADLGAIEVDAVNDDMEFMVTGPNGYSADFEGDFTAEVLVPGVYSVAGTAEGFELVETKVEVQPARIVEVIPTFVVYRPEDTQAAGAEEQQAQTQQGQTAQGQEGQAAAADERAQERVVQVSLVDFAIEMPDSIPAGTVTFEVTNNGSVEHNFEIEGEGVEESFGSNLQPGDTETMTVELEPGTYEVYCPVGDHREMGMELELTVTEARQQGQTQQGQEQQDQSEENQSGGAAY